MRWKTVDLCTIDLAAGHTTLQFHAVKNHWTTGPNIRRLSLTPAK